jgi:dihydroorotase
MCDVMFHFGGTDSNFTEVEKADPQSLKLYLGKTTGELLLRDAASLERHFGRFPKDRPIVLHACDDGADEAKSLEKTCANIENCVLLAQKTQRRIHIAHVSSGKEILIAERWKRCTTEVAPHHLFLSKSDLERLGPYGKVYPALRSEQKRIGLWKVLENVDCIATDHAPHTPEDKENGAAGFPGLETSAALMLDACAKGLLDRIWVAERMSGRVADAFGMSGKGRLETGCSGDLTIADPKMEWTVDASEFETKCKWSPFDGKTLKGRVRTVIRGGKPLYVENEFWD